MTKKTSYKVALARIESIVDIVENQSPDVDELADLVKEGTKLVALCKEKLRKTESELNDSLKELDQND